MRISHKHNFVYIAVPRTASTTTSHILNEFSEVRSVVFRELPEGFPFYSHISAKEVKKIFDERRWNWDDYRRFCVVRNPYDRVVSHYLYYQKVRNFKRESNGFFYRTLSKAKELMSPKTFKRHVLDIKSGKIKLPPLKHYTCDYDGSMLIEDILIFENLLDELVRYMSDLGIAIDKESIPRLNDSRGRSNYRDYYDKETKKIISSIYAYEIDRFGYVF